MLSKDDLGFFEEAFGSRNCNNPFRRMVVWWYDLANVNNPQQNKAIEAVKSCGVTCRTCGQPLTKFSAESRGSQQFVNGQCGADHEAQSYVVD
jgi:hypothetical protein